LEHNAYYHLILVANTFFFPPPIGFPAPGEGTDVTTNSIRQHGSLLLTTVTAFGAGCPPREGLALPRAHYRMCGYNEWDNA
jgi:hypothetical protein